MDYTKFTLPLPVMSDKEEYRGTLISIVLDPDTETLRLYGVVVDRAGDFLVYELDESLRVDLAAMGEGEKDHGWVAGMVCAVCTLELRDSDLSEKMNSAVWIHTACAGG